MNERRSVFPHRPTRLRRGSLEVAAAKDLEPSPGNEPKPRRPRARRRKQSRRTSLGRRLGALAAAIAVLGLGAGIFGGPERWGDLPELIRAGFGERIALDGLLERTDPGVDAGSTTTASVTPRAHEADPDWHALLERAISHSEAGRDEEAEASFINALFEAEKLDVDHPGLTSVLDHFGYFYDQRQRYEEAIPLYLRALDGYRASVGEEHEYFVGIERRIAYAYRAQGRVAEALLHLSAAVTATIALSGDHGIEVAYGYKEIGDLRRMAGDEASAQADYRRALRAARETLPDDHELVMLLEEYLGER